MASPGTPMVGFAFLIAFGCFVLANYVLCMRILLQVKRKIEPKDWLFPAPLNKDFIAQLLRQHRGLYPGSSFLRHSWFSTYGASVVTALIGFSLLVAKTH